MDKKIIKYGKNEILEKICVSSRIDNLGLFIGSGFSKAVMSDSGQESLSWKELLKKICIEYEIESENLFYEGYTYPLIASKIINIVADKKSISQEKANKDVKGSIARLVNDTPNDCSRKKFNEYLEQIKPNWIVTTNYDAIIEKIVGVKAYPILPQYLFYNTKNILPIYHIHGSVLEPSSIVITNEDYAKAMRPSDYRYSRLPILMKESTVLMIGYALGDLNVISALDFRNNLYNNTSVIDNDIIQLVYTSNPQEECYEHNGVIIYEYDNLISFFNELITYLNKYKSRIGVITNAVNKKIDEFVSSEIDYIQMFEFNTNNYRDETIEFVNSLDSSYCYIYTQYISFLERMFDVTMTNAKHAYQFHFYDYYLNVLLDLIKNIKVEEVPTIYVAFLIEKLDEISYYVWDTPGNSYDAFDTWKRRMKEIPIEFVDFIKTSSKDIKHSFTLNRLINLID